MLQVIVYFLCDSLSLKDLKGKVGSYWTSSNRFYNLKSRLKSILMRALVGVHSVNRQNERRQFTSSHSSRWLVSTTKIWKNTSYTWPKKSQQIYLRWIKYNNPIYKAIFIGVVFFHHPPVPSCFLPLVNQRITLDLPGSWMEKASDSSRTRMAQVAGSSGLRLGVEKKWGSGLL